ncbi:IS3 family transposase [Pseudogracilibacillus auburnensis]|uniref:IS3 family transposase n=1 Tax=Pseudogracilibacillus auburnensis TaxID=1494959 RepID=UPI00364272E4
MRSNSKHPVDELERYIQMYLDEGWSYRKLSEEKGLLLSETAFNTKVLRYQEHGLTGIQTKRRNNHYSKEFKDSIVKEYVERGTPVRELARKYNIPSHETVRKWIIKYTKGEGLKTYSPKPEVYTMKSRKVTHDEKIKIVKACLANNLSYKEVAENILNRAFQADYNAMEVLLTDITEFKYGGHSKAYLSAILDYGENKIVAYKLSQHNNNALVRDTVTQIEDTIIPKKTLFHSDRGFQYTSHGFKQFVEKHQITQSMSRVGKCIDNGPMENFWGIIKEEMYRLTTYNSFEKLEEDINTYIEFYNTKRVTLKMGLRIPA